MEFSRQEYWSGLPFFSGDLPDPGIKLGSPASQADSLLSEFRQMLIKGHEWQLHQLESQPDTVFRCFLKTGEIVREGKGAKNSGKSHTCQALVVPTHLTDT